ncbi:hypothetical protein KOI35_08800 [Actinoplanes bogorensis]|uniref:Uncharacterized protein n=1 Tax=Paractinoplanes bogorensis TaxID=1610840 RepID=A0ABS5YLJ9_9ACTN|nr:hypothetical protein [Actinoplanes bogorensis]MBU2663603.1 hypothetical protein [Actinoplanes bogorensis]
MSGPAPALLVLRRVPDDRRDLAAAMAGLPPATGPGDLWWELVDAAAPPGMPAAAVALTRAGADGFTHIVALAAVSTVGRDPLTRLIRELVAALRRTETGVISLRGGRPDVDDALLAEEFVPVGDNLFVLHL